MGEGKGVMIWENSIETCIFSSVQFSHSVVPDFLRPHELQHARRPCPSPTPGVYSNSGPSSWWCHSAISASVVPISWPQSLPASGSFPMSQLFSWGGRSTGVSFSASVLPVNTQDLSPYDDLQDLLELTPQKDVLFIIGDWNANVGSQETPRVTGKFRFGV